jgi:hypothetical protein
MKETMKPVEVDLNVQVQVTEYVRPDATKINHVVALHNDYWLKNEAVWREGLRFTLEKCGNGVAAVSLEEPTLGDFIIELCPQDLWQIAIPKILNEFKKEDFDTWKEGFNS